MKRLLQTPRPHAAAQLNEIGCTYHADYWEEGACYRFNAAQIDELETAALQVHDLCLRVVDKLITEQRLGELGIETVFHPLISASWARRDGHLYGRFDFAYDGVRPPRLLEYNADTPTALIEASLGQWYWLNDRYPHADQFNSLHEALIARWQALRPQLPALLHFASAFETDEDYQTLLYLCETAQLAGQRSELLEIGKIGFDGERFVDQDDVPIEGLCKLYPWEWLLREEFALPLIRVANDSGFRWIEPPWKMVLSNKAILALLWEHCPGHPNLLPSYFFPFHDELVKKPFWSREGAGLTVIRPNESITTPTLEPAVGYVYQQWHQLPCFDGHFPICGVWMVGNDAVGLGMREDRQAITQNTSRFVPHYFE